MAEIRGSLIGSPKVNVTMVPSLVGTLDPNSVAGPMKNGTAQRLGSIAVVYSTPPVCMVLTRVGWEVVAVSNVAAFLAAGPIVIL